MQAQGSSLTFSVAVEALDGIDTQSPCLDFGFGEAHKVCVCVHPVANSKGFAPSTQVR